MNRTDQTWRIPMAQPAFLGMETYNLCKAFLARNLSQGEWVARFEAEFAAKLGVKHAIAVSSGTAALHLALLAAGVKPGDTVLVPTLTYAASVAAIRYCGAIPVFTDVDEETWGIGSAPRRERTQHSLPVHLYGVSCQVWSDSIEDCAESLGATTNFGAMATGRAGLAGTFSFYANKILTTGEGGMVITDDDARAAEIRLLRGQGQDPTRRYWHTRVGFNYRMTDLQAAIGVGQLARLDEMLTKRHDLRNRYQQELAGCDLQWQKKRPGTGRAPWVFACLLPYPSPYAYPQYRDDIMAKLAREGIETRPTFPCVHQMPPYREPRFNGAGDQTGWVEHSFPIAEDIAARGILLPLFEEMTIAQVDEVCAALRRLL